MHFQRLEDNDGPWIQKPKGIWCSLPWVCIIATQHHVEFFLCFHICALCMFALYALKRTIIILNYNKYLILLPCKGPSSQHIVGVDHTGLVEMEFKNKFVILQNKIENQFPTNFSQSSKGYLLRQQGQSFSYLCEGHS